MTLRIGFDLDGVLADMESELVRQAEALFGESTKRLVPVRADRPEAEEGEPDTDAGQSGRPHVALALTARQKRRLWRHVARRDRFWESLTETESGIVSRLSALAAEHRWEIIFLTKRPESAGGTSQRQSQQWLIANGFPLPSVFVVQGSRGRIADALDLDVVIDDRPENCLDVVLDSRARAVLVWRYDDRDVPAIVRRPGITVLSSTFDALAFLAQESSSRDRPRLVDRVKRKLGFKEPAGV